MIKSEAGKVTITGTRFDVIFELHHLIRTLAKENPTLLAAVLYKDNKITEDAILRMNDDEAELIEVTIDAIENTRKEMES